MLEVEEVWCLDFSSSSLFLSEKEQEEFVFWFRFLDPFWVDGVLSGDNGRRLLLFLGEVLTGVDCSPSLFQRELAA